MARVDRLVDGPRPPIIPKPTAVSSLRETLLLRAIAGDAVAWAIVQTLIPTNLPTRVIRAARDGRIRELAAMLRRLMPGVSTHELARLLASAGAALDRGHATAARELPFLTAAEQLVVDDEIVEALSWLPARRDGRRWPAWRQIFSVLAG
jgi:hypothetical protein